MLLSFLPSCAIRQPVALLPGVVFYDGPEELTGKLAFLLANGNEQEKSASIYEFDLSHKKLEKVTDSPAGEYFITPDKGDLYCVIYGPFEPSGRDWTNAFIYSASLSRKRTLHFDKTPYSTCIADGQVFFEFEKTGSHNMLYDYDAALDQLRPAESSDARWQKRRDANFAYRAFDGRYIYFEGSGAPADGFTLVSSPLDPVNTASEDPKGRNVKVLHRFSVLRVFGGGMYLLNHMSPDGRYAVVRLQEPTLSKTEPYQGWANTYYAVDVTNGKIRPLLKENVAHVSDGSMSGVWWVGD